ncbi:MAG TPA: xanthine dehydrogenase family protein subunit M [Chloroflexota bacterium]|nr:xanthine dehydrogenase family protein subunit M [Chloroflexota bacterium]
MRRFDYSAPASLAEASRILAGTPDSRPLAGGTDLLIQMKERGRPVRHLVSLRRVGELGALSADGSLDVGAMVTCGELAWSAAVKKGWPMVVDGADLVGSVQIRNKATVGGNMCNAAPSADVAPSLIALDATAHVVGPNGQRTVPLGEFFRGPGQTVLGQGELLVRLVAPRPPAGGGGAYLRHVPRREMDIAVVGVAVHLRLDRDGRTVGDARVVLASVAPTPIRSPSAEKALIGSRIGDDVLRRAGEGAAADARPITDVRASAEYRRELLKVYTRRVGQIAYQRARENG